MVKKKSVHKGWHIQSCRNIKIHTLVDGWGNPIALVLGPGNEPDSVRKLLLTFSCAGFYIAKHDLQNDV